MAPTRAPPAKAAICCSTLLVCYLAPLQGMFNFLVRAWLVRRIASAAVLQRRALRVRVGTTVILGAASVRALQLLR